MPEQTLTRRTSRAARSAVGATRRVVLGSVLAGIPLVFVGSLTNDPYNVPKLAVLVAGVGAGVALSLPDLAGSPTAIRLLRVPALSLVVPLSVSWLWSPYKVWALFGQYPRFNGLVPYALFALLGILVVDAFWRRPDTLAWILAVSGGLVGTYAFVQSLGVDPFWSPGTDAGSEYAPSTIGHFNFVGGFLAITLPAALWLWGRGTGRHRYWGMWATIATTLGLLMANSQGGWAAALAGTSVMVGTFLQDRFAIARKVGLLLAAAIAVGIVVTVAASSFLPQSLAGGTVSARAGLWQTAIEMGAQSPLVGRGPAAYSIEGVRYRSLASVLAEPNTKADEPHSVPLSFWANAGLLGALGFLTLAAWVVRAGLTITRGDLRSTAFFAAAVGYLVQSLVSIDMLPLRAGLWLAIAGLVISKHGVVESELEDRGPSLIQRWRIVRVAIALLTGLLCVWYAAGLVVADRRVLQGKEAFADGSVSEAKERFEAATAYRYEPRYLLLYAEGLGTAALNAGRAGAPLIEEMRRVNTYLENFPETFGMLATARTLHYWSRFEPTANEEALEWLDKARPLDPQNPEIDIRTAQVLISMGGANEARDLLEGWRPQLEGRLATFWGALSIARLIDGDPYGSAETLDVAISLDPGECRVILAQVLFEHEVLNSAKLDESTSFRAILTCGRGEFEWLKDLLDHRS